jgi:hypothetical protein
MKKREHLLPVTLLVAFPLLLYAPFLFGGKVLYWGVYLLQFLPWRQLAVDQIQAGHWPLWNPYLGAGTPLAANLQTAAFYPPNILSLLMPVEQSFAWELALHVALAGLFTYTLGRTLGLNSFGALVSGLAYGGGGYVVARWVFPSMVYATAWLPLMLVLAERLLRSATGHVRYPTASTRARRGLGHWLSRLGLLALVVALQLLAGHAQTSFYSLLIVAAFALFRLVQWQLAAGRLQVRLLLQAACSLLLATLWGFALAAIQILPSAELAAHSQRSGTLSDLRFAFELSFWPWRLITLFAPDFFGHPARNQYWAYGTYWEEAAFVGILPLILGVSALVRWWRKRPTRRRLPRALAPELPETDQRAPGLRPDTEPSQALSLVPFCALLSLLSVVLALGDHTPLYPLLFRYVPGFGLFQAPARLMLGYALGIALLAGIGAETLRLTLRTKTLLRLAVVAGVGVGLAGILGRLALPAVRPSFGNSTARLGLTLGLAAALLLLQGRRSRRGRWQALVVTLVAADLLAFGWGLAPGIDPALYRAPVATAEFLQSQPAGRIYVAGPYAQQMYNEYVSLRSFGPADPAYLQELTKSLLPNLNVLHHLPGVGNYDPLTVGLYQDLWHRLEGGGDAPPSLAELQPTLDLFAARYIISEEDLSLPLLYDAGPTLDSNTGPRIYQYDGALPPALVVPQARVVQDRETRLGLLFDAAFDPRAEVLLSHPPPPESCPQVGETLGRTGPQPEPSVLRGGPDRVIVRVEMAQAGYLMLADTYYPGWKATVDAEPAEILPADHAFRAVCLGPGEHSVVFEYAPLSFRLGAWTTAASALLLLLALTSRWLRRRAT